MRIIDNKQVDITDGEWQLYQDICKHYDSPTRQGKFLFTDLFEVDERGIIQALKPPRQAVSMEIWLYVVAVMQQQHLREMYRMMSVWKKDLEEQFSEKLKAVMEEKK